MIITKELQQPVATHAMLWKFGFNADIATDDETVWDKGGLYSYTTAATALQLFSNNGTADTSSGTGARTVTLYGLNASHEPISETVTMNGIAGVTTSNEFLRLNRMTVVTAGSGGTNTGALYAGTGISATSTASGSGTPGSVWALMGATNGQTLMSTWTVPAGKTLYMTKLFCTSSVGGAANVTMTFSLYARPNGGAWNIKDKFVTGGSPVTIQHAQPLTFAEKTDIEVRAKRSTGTGDASAGYAGVIGRSSY